MITFDYIPSQRKAKIICNESLFALIRANFSVKNEAAKYSKKWDKKVPDRYYAITPTGLFDFGLVAEIRKLLIEKGITGVTYTDTFKTRFKVGFELEEYFDDLKYKSRDYQKESIQKGLKTGFGTYEIGTGGGKSLITALLIENFYKVNPKGKDAKVLILVPGIGLVSQLNNDFQEYGVTFEHSQWTGKIAYKDSQVVICNFENLISKFSDNQFVVDVDLLIVDEVHGITSKNKITKILTKFRTSNKFGFTGTLPKADLDRWKIIGIFGPVIYEKSSKELRDENYLVDVFVKMIKLKHKTKSIDWNAFDVPLAKDGSKNKNEKYLKELQYLYNCEKRNDLIAKIAGKLQNNTLVLVNHLEQGNNLEEQFQLLENKQTFFIKGETEVQEREEVKNIMSIDNDVIALAMSKIFATGINIPNIHNLIFVAGGKAFIRIVQGIGRGLRLHPTKTKLTIYDIYDNLKYSMDHAEDRKKIYDDEQIQWSEVEINL